MSMTMHFNKPSNSTTHHSHLKTHTKNYNNYNNNNTSSSTSLQYTADVQTGSSHSALNGRTN